MITEYELGPAGFISRICGASDDRQIALQTFLGE
jgi:hypothetical protein